MIETLASIPLFSTLAPPHLQKLASISSLKSYEPGALLCYEKECSFRLMFLVEGLAKAYKIDKYDNEIVLYLIQKGEMLSQIESLRELRSSYYANISFMEHSSVLSIDYRAFWHTFIQSNTLMIPFIDEVFAQANKIRLLIDREFVYNAVAKVAMMLDRDLEMFNRLRRHDIALILHIQPATLSRVLAKLKASGIIEVVHGQVAVADKKRLREIFLE